MFKYINKGNNNLVIALYSHPDYYPPTLNAIESLSKKYDNIFIVHRNILGLDWDYPTNVHLITHGKSVNVRIAEKVGLLKKIVWYFLYTVQIFKVLKNNKDCVFLIYDYMPLLAYRLVNKLIKRPRILWYHNHDVADPKYIRNYSLSWWAWKSEDWIFPYLDIFSLPSLDRKSYFPMNKFKGKFYYLPNFPSKLVYEKFYNHNEEKKISDSVRILFHGSIGTNHGLEEIISVLNMPIRGKRLELVLKGFISHEYKLLLQSLAEKYNVKEQLIFLPISGLRGVIENMQSCHVGIGIYKKDDIMNNTVGTASNKIYEYAAAGMPVLLYDNPYFRDVLKNNDWALFTDTRKESLLECLSYIVDNYKQLSENAINKFNHELSFETNFNLITNI